MKQKGLKLSSIFLLTIWLARLQAQEATTATGGDATGNGGFASYSVGQVVYTNNTGAGGSVLQGIQQPYDISVVLGIEEQGITLTCIAYPNPTSDYLTLDIEGDVQTHYSTSLIDLNGKLFTILPIVGKQTTIPMEQYAVGSYFLTVTQNNKALKTFKIIKQ